MINQKNLPGKMLEINITDKNTVFYEKII